MNEAQSAAFQEAISKRDRLFAALQELDTFFENNHKLRLKYLTEGNYVNDFNPEDEGRYYSPEDIKAMPEGSDKTFYSLCGEIRSLCDEILISEDGKGFSDFERYFITRGYRVVVTSRDAFGPLGAAMVSKNFRVNFG